MRGLVFDEPGENADMEMYSHVLVDMTQCTDIRSLLRSARSRSVTVILLGTPALLRFAPGTLSSLTPSDIEVPIPKRIRSPRAGTDRFH